jgi:hypothetical protein
MVRAMFYKDVFVPKQRHIKATVKLRTSTQRAQVQALIDSGATDNFISPMLANQYKLPLEKIDHPRIIHNVDGTCNSLGSVTHATNLEVSYGINKVMQHFFIINLGGDEMLLGYPFLAQTNPPIDWKEGKFYGNIIIATEDAGQWTPERQDTFPIRVDPEMYETEEPDLTFIPNNERGIVHYPKKLLRRTTTAIELAVQAADKKERPWQEQVPKVYHQYRKVFSEEAAQRFPGKRPYDHAIELTDDAPAAMDCKIYSLAPAEQTALNKFLKEHLKKKYIKRSNSNYASPFFFVKKKDGKLRPVQDYRRLNKYTVRNQYPLPLIKELITKICNKDWFTKFDVRWGYNNIRIHKGDKWKAAFKTNRGLFEPKVMFFGLTNSPATFQTMMDDIFREEIAKGEVIIYMDNILIPTKGTLH